MVCKVVNVTRIMDDGEVRVYRAKRWFSTEEEKAAVKEAQRKKAHRLLDEYLDEIENINRIDNSEKDYISSLFGMDDDRVIKDAITDYMSTLKF